METIPPDRLELALQASNEGIWDWLIGDESIYYSERIVEFLGYGKESPPNIILHAKDHLFEDDLEAFQLALDATIAPGGEDLLATDCRYHHPDGTFHWLRIRGVVDRDQDGKASRIVGSIIDISRRKRAETALEEERYKLRELIENIPVNVYYKDLESRFVLANTSTAKKLGAASVETLLGKSDHDFFEKSHADVARKNELEIMQSRTAQINEIQRETWEGKEDTWAETSKTPWLDRKGKVSGTFGITSDITNLVRTQRSLTKVAEELQRRNVAIEEELQLAREIQQALLPQSLDDLALHSNGREIRFGCRYAPASEMAGDFFEVMPISEHCIGIFLCDVMGHGVRASLVVSMLRGLIEKERESATSPEWFLYGVNQGLVSILERAGVTLFATAIYCVIDLKEGTLQYSCAGHPAPVVVRLGQGKQLPASSATPNPALGLFPKASYSGETVSLDEVDRMLLFTDGLNEVGNTAGEQWDMAPIIRTMEETMGGDLESSLDKLISGAREHAANGEFEDDVCLFAMTVESGL